MDSPSDPQERWDLLLSLFETAVELPPGERTGFIQHQAEERGLDREMTQELMDMLRAHDGPPLNLEDGLTPVEPELPERLGPYRILRRIARGGMGEVLLAERADNTFQRKVAIKTLAHSSAGPAWVSRFQREQEIHARLQHPNIAQIFDAGVTETGLPFLVMDYVQGQTILEYVQSIRASIYQRIDLMVQICRAVAFAHNQLVLHRDIKPSNILVTDSGEAKLLDFGIAKLLDQAEDGEIDLTRPGERLMTPRYASPEQIRGERLAVTSDVYSLGVVLYELLTGKPPYTATGSYELSQKIVEQHVEPPRCSDASISVAIPSDLQAICLKVLEKTPTHRYPSAAALADDLQRFREHRSVSARRPSWADRAKRLLRRHPVAAPLSALAISTIIAGGTAVFWQARKAAFERDVARAERDRAEQVTQVLVDLFDSDPYAESDERRDDLTLREFLTRRASDLGTELDSQPGLRATLFDLFANLLTNLSLLDEAETYAEQALTLRRSLHGNQPHEDIARSLDTLGTLRQHQGQFESAEKLFRQCLAMRERLYPESHPLISTSVNNLSVLFHYWGNPDRETEALALDERAMSINVLRFGEESPEAAQSYNNMGAFYVTRKNPGDAEKALPLLERARAIRVRHLGENHPNTVNTTSNLANLLHDLGRLEQADLLFGQAIVGTRASIGDRHTRVADVQYGYGHLLMDLKRWEQAETAFTESLEIYSEALPPKHPFIADTQVALGGAVLAGGRPEQAARHYELAVAIFAQDPDAHDKYLETLFFTARAWKAAGQFDAAEDHARQVLEGISATGGPAGLQRAAESLLASLAEG